MRLSLLEVLACPECQGDFFCSVLGKGADEEILSGTLVCNQCGTTYRIEGGIPRFVEADNYASSFGYQWNRFRSEQIDWINGTGLSEKRFYAETGWSREWMVGKWIADVGCGAGRFLDIASQNDCQVVGIDMSDATDAARATFEGRKNLHLVQASIYKLPFRSAVFDGCYCIGVIQHTPEPHESIKALPRLLKKGGLLALTIYERKPWTKLNAKYLIRPVTKRINKAALLYTIKGLMPLLFPITEISFRIPYLGRALMFGIPVANYVNEPRLTIRQRYQWAILDTFDMLAPRYDKPQTENEVIPILRAEGIEKITRLNNGGLNLIGQKR